MNISTRIKIEEVTGLEVAAMPPRRFDEDGNAIDGWRVVVGSIDAPVLLILAEQEWHQLEQLVRNALANAKLAAEGRR